MARARTRRPYSFAHRQFLEARFHAAPPVPRSLSGGGVETAVSRVVPPRTVKCWSSVGSSSIIVLCDSPAGLPSSSGRPTPAARTRRTRGTSVLSLLYAHFTGCPGRSWRRPEACGGSCGGAEAEASSGVSGGSTMLPCSASARASALSASCVTPLLLSSSAVSEPFSCSPAGADGVAASPAGGASMVSAEAAGAPSAP